MVANLIINLVSLFHKYYTYTYAYNSYANELIIAKYDETLAFYCMMFQKTPPSNIWGDKASEFDLHDSKKQVNLYRLAVMYSIKTINPQFLKAKSIANAAIGADPLNSKAKKSKKQMARK